MSAKTGSVFRSSATRSTIPILQNLVKGDKVNLEADMLARYLEALLAKK